MNQLQQVWLRDKKVLDIGSNNGIVDIVLAMKHQPKLIIGVDIDHRMVKTSIDNMQKVINDSEQMELLVNQLRKQRSSEDEEMVTSYEVEKRKIEIERQKKLKALLERVEKLPKSLQLSIQGELNNLARDPSIFIKNLEQKEELPSAKDLKNYLYGKICFRNENYIANTASPERFEVILCLSTIKYVHLNFGDTGIKALFLKAYS